MTCDLTLINFDKKELFENSSALNIGSIGLKSLRFLLICVIFLELCSGNHLIELYA